MTFLGVSCNQCLDEGIVLEKAGRPTNSEYKVAEDGTVTYVTHYSCGHVEKHCPHKPIERNGILWHDHDGFGKHPVNRKHRS